MGIFQEWAALAKENKAKYPPGTRIELIQMNDPFAPVPAGTRGTVDHVDDAGQLHMRWDNGRTLALVSGEDSFRKLTEEELAEEQKQELEQENNENMDEGEDGPVMTM